MRPKCFGRRVLSDVLFAWRDRFGETVAKATLLAAAIPVYLAVVVAVYALTITLVALATILLPPLCLLAWLSGLAAGAWTRWRGRRGKM